MKIKNLKFCLILSLSLFFILNNCSSTSRLRKIQIKNAFTTVAKLHPARYGHAATVVDNDIYLFGGSSEDDILYNGPLPTIEKYSIEDNTFTKIADCLIPRKYHSACNFERKIYIIGGIVYNQTDKLYKNGGEIMTPVFRWRETDVFEVYDLSTNEIKNLTPLPTPRNMAASVAFNGKIYVIGGIRTFYTEHLEKNILSRNTKQDFLANINININKRPSKIVEVYDIKKDKWFKVANMPTARACAIVYKDYKIYAIGGSNGFSSTTAFEVYNIFADRWEKLPDLPFSVCAHRCEVLNDKIYVFGDYQNLERVCQYDFATGEWSLVESNFKGCRYSAVVKRKGKIYILGGTVANRDSYLSTGKGTISNKGLLLPNEINVHSFKETLDVSSKDSYLSNIQVFEPGKYK